MSADKQRTEKRTEQRTRGVRKLEASGPRPKPHGVEWRVDGKRKTEWFKERADRDKRYAELVAERRQGTLARAIPLRDQQEWIHFQAAVEGTNWREVVAGWRAWMTEKGTSPCKLTIREAAELFVKEGEKRVKNGTLAADTMAHRRTKIRTFADAFGANRLTQITSTELEDWIDGLGFEAPATFNSWRAHVRAFYSHFAEQVPVNPAAKIRVRADLVEEVEILTVPETARLFAYALENHPEALGRLAVEAFVGLRFSSACRVAKEDIKVEQRGIELPAVKIKTRRRYYVDGLPDNLWPWLAKTPESCWHLTTSDYMHLKSAMFAGADIAHPHNCLRHSFATYHLAAHKSPGRTATILCHSSEKKLWERYNGKATQTDGLRYFTISPANVEELAGRSD